MTKYHGNTEEITVLKQAAKEGVWEALRDLTIGQAQSLTGTNPFPLRTAREVAGIFKVSIHAVRVWVRRGELHPRYQVLSGRSCRLIFTTPDLLAFFDRNFPSEADLAHPCHPRSRKAALVEKMFRMNRLYARRRARASHPDGNRQSPYPARRGPPPGDS